MQKALNKHRKMVDMTVVITRFSENDDMCAECLKALLKQTNIKLRILFLDQKGSKKIAGLAKKISSSSIQIDYFKIPKKSLSFARNYGINHSKTYLIAFCDADTVPAINWAEEIYKTFKISNAAIVGTRVVPRWPKKPSWFHRSKYILEFYSLIDLGKKRAIVPKVVGASFAINRNLLKNYAYFNEGRGRIKGKLLGGEETELCHRATLLDLKTIYTPFTFVFHVIPLERMNLRWIQKRAYFGGLSRSIQGGNIQTFNKSYSIVDFPSIALILPAYVFGYLRAKFRYEI